MGPLEVEDRFRYHSPSVEQVSKYDAIREAAKVLAYVIIGLTPESREQSIAITTLEEVVFWANAAIARRS